MEMPFSLFKTNWGDMLSLKFLQLTKTYMSVKYLHYVYKHKPLAKNRWLEQPWYTRISRYSDFSVIASIYISYFYFYFCVKLLNIHIFNRSIAVIAVYYVYITCIYHLWTVWDTVWWATWTHCIWLCSSQMPCDGHLYTGLADIGKRGHNHIHGNSIFVCWWRLSHGAGGVGNPGTPVKLKGIRVEKRLLYLRGIIFS